MSLTTLDAVKLQLGISGHGQDAQLQSFLDAASAAIEDYVGYPIESATVTEYHSGTGFVELVLRRRPVSSIASIHIDHAGAWGQLAGRFGSEHLLTAGTQYALVVDGEGVSNSGLVRRLGATNSPFGVMGYSMGSLNTYRPGYGWPVGEGNIKVVYVAGYTTVPTPIKQATINLVAWLRNNVSTGGLVAQSETLGKYSVSLASVSGDSARNALAAAGDLATTRSLLTRYRDLSI